MLFQGKGPIAWTIKRFGKGRHSHAAMVFNIDGQWTTFEFREFIGWRKKLLIEQVVKYPKQIDVFRPVDSVAYSSDSVNSWDSRAQSVALAAMQSWSGHKYSWRTILKLAIHYLPFLRLMPQETNDEKETDIHVCSTAVCVALRKALADPVPCLADEMVTPTDLARSALLRYQFSIEEK